MKNSLYAREENEWDSILKKFQFLSPDAPFNGIIWAETPELQAIIQKEFHQFFIENKISFQTLSEITASTFDAYAPNNLTMVIAEAIDTRIIKKINLQRDRRLQRNEKWVFILLLDSQQDWYELAYDWLSRTDFQNTFHDIRKYDTEQEPDFSSIEFEITQLKTEFETLKLSTSATKINRALFLASRLTHLQDYNTANEVASWVLKHTSNKENKAVAFGLLGINNYRLGNLTVAYTFYKKEEKIKEELNDKLGLYITYVNQALLLIENLNRKEEGLKLLEKALEITKDLKAQPHIEQIESLLEKYKTSE